LPKLEPVGVFRDVDPNPVNVSIKALPIPPRNVTELVPDPAHPPHVNTPDVEKVTGSALAMTDAAVSTDASIVALTISLNIGLSPCMPASNCG